MREMIYEIPLTEQAPPLSTGDDSSASRNSWTRASIPHLGPVPWVITSQTGPAHHPVVLAEGISQFAAA